MSDTADSTTLDNESLAMLLEEIIAMAASGRSLVSGLADLDDGAMGKIGSAASLVRTRIENGEPASAAIASLSEKYRAPIRVSMEIMAETGSTQPIYETVRLIREANETRRQVQLSVVNPMFNVVVAATVTFFVLPWIMVSLSEAELIKSAFSPTPTEIWQTFAQNFFIAGAATVAVVGLFGAMLYWNLKRSLRGSDVSQSYSTFCRWVAMRVGLPHSANAGNTEAGRVIETAAEVAGPQFAEAWATVVENIRRGSQTPAALAMPKTTPEPVGQCVIDLVSGRRDGASIALDMLRLSDLYRQTSRRRRTWWIDVVPQRVSAILMITMIVIILRAILQPLFDVVSEVVR
ncbi:type II secretion system F family protein [Aporhodopirellula aestuarii]|uniref:Type II secretion system F family protein n=1 Tax=Aporhodopirellula aestuarii TaxID=2950107 RepID=A0ABT0U9F0_9BACT|nr:type II secretion system F family protein [Aporhodopirellula aestuarii]MCM2373165.1 type II secretion system F family protein [Aporhodopirellula aestuarii]